MRQVFRDSSLVGDVEEFCAIPAPPDENVLEALPRSAGHTSCYVSPYGDVFPCVQFPLPTGNVRKQKFIDIWRHSDQMNEVRAIRLKDLTTCTSGARMSRVARAARVWPLWKGICAGPPRRIASALLRKPAFHRPICWRRSGKRRISYRFGPCRSRHQFEPPARLRDPDARRCVQPKQFPIPLQHPIVSGLFCERLVPQTLVPKQTKESTGC